jgi:hypothetical protein
MICFVTTPLLTRDARALRRLVRPWLQHGLRLTVVVAAVTVTVVHVAYVQQCNDTTPCRPDIAGSFVAALLFASAIAIYIHARLAMWLAVGFAVLSTTYDLVLTPLLVTPTWLIGVDVSYVDICLLAVGATSWRHRAVARRWLARVRHEAIPGAPAAAPAGLRRRGRTWRVTGLALLVVAAGLIAWFVVEHVRVARQQQAAPRVTTEVVDTLGASTVVVRLPDGERLAIRVLDVADHPVGQRMDLYVDQKGLRQPVSEPYDATGWLLLGVLVGLLGLVCWRRGVDRATAPRRLFTSAVPVSKVYLRPGSGVVAVYAGDAQLGEPPIAEIPYQRLANQPDPLAVIAQDRFEVSVGGTPMWRLVPARLYGVPVPRQWCTVVVDGQALVPRRALRARSTAPPVTESIVDGQAEPDKADPYQLHVHVPRSVVGYVLIAATALALTVLSALLLPALTYVTALGICAVIMAVSVAMGWLRFIRPRLAWNGGGVAVIGTVGVRRLPWSEVTWIEPRRFRVAVHATTSEHVVRARLGLLEPNLRSADELVEALRAARQVALAGSGSVDLPSFPPLSRRLGLYLMWTVSTPALAWLLTWWTSH